MHRIIIIIVLIGLMVGESKSQDSFVVQIPAENQSGKVLVVSDSKEDMYISYLTKEGDQNKINLVKLSSCGNVIWRRSYNYINTSNFNLVDLILTQQDELFIGIIGQEGDKYVGGILKVDMDGNMIFKTGINTNASFYLYNLFERNDGSVLIFGNTNVPFNANIIIMDSNTGEIIQQRRGINTVIWGFAISTTDGGYICRNGSTFYKLDANFNQEWEKVITGAGATYKPVEVSDGYIYSKFEYGSRRQSFITKLDLEGNIVWQTENKPVTGRTNIQVRQDGSVGQIGATQTNTNYTLPYLVMVDPNGDIRMERTYDPFGEATVATDLKFLNDDSALIVGSLEGAIYIIKTDANLVIDCDYEDVITKGPQEDLTSMDRSTTTGQQASLFLSEQVVQKEDVDIHFDMLCQPVFQEPTEILSDTICLGDTITIQITDPMVPFAWDNGDTDRMRIITDPGEYTISYFLCEETIIDRFTILNMECIPDVYIPNVFTPNSDGTNDFFLSYATDELVDYKMTIYNRWGDRLFISTEISTGWDGTFKSKDMPTGVYVYQIEYAYRGDPNGLEYLTGDLTLVR